MDLRFGHWMRRLTVAAFAAVAVCISTLPAAAEDTTAGARAVAAKRSTTSFTLQQPAITAAPGRSTGGGFLFFPGAGPQPGINVGGRVPVGKSHVYVPYYGNVSGDPAHPGVQGTAGIAYGFRTWDISVLNGGFGSSQQTLPGVDPPKNNPALSLSVRF